MIKLEKELLSVCYVDVGRPYIFDVEYEWDSVRCVDCKVFGHSLCANNTQESNSVEQQNVDEQDKESSEY